MKTNAKVVMIAAIMSVTTGCAGTYSVFGGADFQQIGTEAGIQANGDMLNHLITNGKASADASDTPAYELRRNQEEGRTTRKSGWKPNMGKVPQNIAQRNS